jgi:hypothetical protein
VPNVILWLTDFILCIGNTLSGILVLATLVALPKQDNPTTKIWSGGFVGGLLVNNIFDPAIAANNDMVSRF